MFLPRHVWRRAHCARSDGERGDGGRCRTAAQPDPRVFLARSLRRRQPRLSVGLDHQGSGRADGVAGGLQAGYNFQRGPFVLGLETDVQLSGAEDRFAPWKFSNPWFGTLRGRAGYALNNILFYGTVGLAYGSLRAQSTVTGLSQARTDIGWTAGAGMEVALFGNWSTRAEYLYVDLNDGPYSITGATNGLESHLLRFGVNYRF